MLHFLVAMVAAASAVSAFEFGGGTCSGTAANPSVYNFQIGEYPAKVISDGQLMFPSSEGVFAVDPSLVTRALETNFQSTDPIIFQVRYAIEFSRSERAWSLSLCTQDLVDL